MNVGDNDDSREQQYRPEQTGIYELEFPEPQLSAADDAVADSLAPVIAQGWSLATAYSLLAWYVFAPQCLSTLAVVKRETNSWRYPLLMLAYLFVLAYAAAFVTYRVTLWFGG